MGANMRVLYYDNCWFTNVGESFIDIGAMEIIKKIFPGCRIANSSNMSSYYVTTRKSRKKFLSATPKAVSERFRLADILNIFDFEYLVLAGMFVSAQHLKGDVSKLVCSAARQGKKIIFLGLGQEPDISEKTIADFRQYLKEINPILIMTRDTKTYDAFKTSVNCIHGIDAAFWVKDIYDPRGFSKGSYDIVSFNRTEEPLKFSNNWEYPIIRPYHFQLSYPEQGQTKKNTFISDIPYDYLSLYANANKVYTDLVHATIISLQYGKEVEYTYTDSRADAFLDMDFISKRNGTLCLNEIALEKTKARIIDEIKNRLMKEGI
ncbi:MAG TPA: polysaccharide pyruvyl transferase family protein [Lachnospiraceae bacterium]|nr:polysaccharide pyruvyl transferase family protein [Lachnospiraceae bacterium]